MTETAPQVVYQAIPLDRIDRNPKQPRLDFDSPEAKQALEELAASIREHGIQTPIRVRTKGDRRYELIAGERRTRASRLAGLTEIPALVGDVEDKNLLRLALVENIQRRDLSPIEEAAAYQELRDEEGGDVGAVAMVTGKSKAHVESRLALLTLPQSVREAIHHGRLTLGCAEVLLELKNTADVLKYAELAIKLGLSPAKLRARIQHLPRKQGKKSDGVGKRKKITAKALSKAFIECYNFASEADASALPDRDRATLSSQVTVLVEQLTTFRNELEAAGTPAPEDAGGEDEAGEEGGEETGDDEAGA